MADEILWCFREALPVFLLRFSGYSGETPTPRKPRVYCITCASVGVEPIIEGKQHKRRQSPAKGTRSLGFVGRDGPDDGHWGGPGLPEND